MNRRKKNKIISNIYDRLTIEGKHQIFGDLMYSEISIDGITINGFYDPEEGKLSYCIVILNEEVVFEYSITAKPTVQIYNSGDWESSLK